MRHVRVQLAVVAVMAAACHDDTRAEAGDPGAGARKPAPAAAPTRPVAPAPAAPAAPDCTKAAVRKVRGAADKAVKAKDYKAAIALLEPVRQACAAAPDAVESAWLAADLAAAYERNGQPLECQRLMAPLAHPSSGLANDSAKVAKAIEHNLERCGKALAAQYAAIKPAACSLTIDRAIASAAVPAAQLPPGATAACLALVPGTRAKDAEDGDVTCPRVALVWKAAKLERQELRSGGDHDALDDDSVCCNLSAIAVGAMAGKTLVRVHGEGRDCNGGTADAATDVYYEWKGPALTVTLDASVASH